MLCTVVEGYQREMMRMRLTLDVSILSHSEGLNGMGFGFTTGGSGLD